jgi:hypothetical protein
MEEKPAGGAAHSSGCFFCNVLPIIERRWDEATGGHFKKSRVEFLKGLRALLDDRIAHLSREEEPRGTHVTVE